jgi:hypothetical protein
LNPSSNLFPGARVGDIWGFVTYRFYTEDDFENGVLRDGLTRREGVNPVPGDVMFKQLDPEGDGIIRGAASAENPRDQKVIGNNSLRFQYGISGGVSWNNFDLSFHMRGVGRRDLWLRNELTFPGVFQWGSLFTHLEDYWMPDNPNARFPRVHLAGTQNTNFNASTATQTRFLLNGAYLRVQNITLGYTVPRDVTQNLHLESLRFTASAENPFLFHHLPRGLDPTLNNVGRGLGYPIMRIFSVGMSLEF